MKAKMAEYQNEKWNNKNMSKDEYIINACP